MIQEFQQAFTQIPQRPRLFWGATIFVVSLLLLIASAPLESLTLLMVGLVGLVTGLATFVTGMD